MSIIGSGAGGGTLAHALAWPGKKILRLERGDFPPREMGDLDPNPLFADGKYMTRDTWYHADGKPFQPQVHYDVGGTTKMYGAAPSVLDVNCQAHELDNLYIVAKAPRWPTFPA